MANNLEATIQTSVKFYSSLTRSQAKGLTPIGTDNLGNDVYIEPGAIAFVSDAFGNSIFLDNRLFGDGANSGGGGGGISEVTLDLIQVTNSKTLADYFDENGYFMSDQIVIKGTSNGTEFNAIEITQSGITIYDSLGRSDYFPTSAQVETIVGNLLQSKYTNALIDDKIAEALLEAKTYANQQLSSVYRYKGSVTNFSDLPSLDLIEGDVYNVTNAYGNYPADTNYAWVGPVYNPNGTLKTAAHWDPIGGKFDTSALKTEILDEVDGKITLAKSEIEADIVAGDNEVKALVNANGSAITNLSGRVQTLETASISYNNRITANTTNINNLATQLTWQ